MAIGVPALSAPVAAATITVDNDGSSDFDTIQAAVDAANPGDVIEVREGTGDYNEVVTVNTSDLTIRGDPGQSGMAGVGASAPRTEEFVLEPGADGLTLVGFILDGTDSIDIDLAASESLSDLTISHNRIEGAEIDIDMNGDGTSFTNVELSWNKIVGDDVDLNADGVDNTSISNFRFLNNEFDGSDGDAVDIDVDSTMNSDVEFVINCNEILNANFDAIEFELDNDPSNSYDITIFNNTIENAGNEGVEFLDVGGSGLAATISFNDIRGNPTGVDVRGDGDPTGITVEQNNIVGNGTGVDHDDSQVLDARDNYWGATNGPSGGVVDPVTGATADGDGDSIDAPDSVRFDPFEAEAVDRPTVCTLAALNGDCIERRYASRDTPEEDICDEPERDGSRQTGRHAGKTRPGGRRRNRSR